MPCDPLISVVLRYSSLDAPLLFPYLLSTFRTHFLMPLTKSAIKRSRQNSVRNARLQPYKTMVKTAMRKFQEAAKAKKKDEMVTLLPQAYKAIDTAAKKGLLHKKTAARKKSLLARTLAAAK